MEDGGKKPFPSILLGQQNMCRDRNSLAGVTGCHLARLVAQKGLGVVYLWGTGRVCVPWSLGTARTGAAVRATTLGLASALLKRSSTLGAPTGCAQGQPASKYLGRG